jgi:octaprenyl-diphosphate synthase
VDAPALATLRQAARTAGKGDAAAARIVALEAAVGADLSRVDADLAAALEGVSEPARSASRHLVGGGGKRVRPSCVLVTSRVMGEGGAPSSRFPLAAAAELIHSATLLHDDVIDDGRERRGLPASRVLWGNLVSVLSGDYLLVRSLELVRSANVVHALDDLFVTLRDLVEGEILQLRGRDLWDLDVERYVALPLERAGRGARGGGAGRRRRSARRVRRAARRGVPGDRRRPRLRRRPRRARQGRPVGPR